MKIPLLVVAGPTAGGKTKLAIDLALRFHGEIISADSMQVYRHMDIGTAKPTPEERAQVPHHLVDILEPTQRFSVAQYAELAHAAIAEVYGRGYLPVLTGGTGLYIQSVIDNIQYNEMVEDLAFRDQLRLQAEEQGNETIHAQLQQVDPELAQQLHPNNLGRVIRALEVYHATGTPMSEWQRQSRNRPSPYEVLMLGLYYEDRSVLYHRINHRVDLMLEGGLVQELEELIKQGFSGTASQAIGYKELLLWLGGEQTYDEAVERLKMETRRYAKRQMTWLRREDRVCWLEAGAGYKSVLEQAEELTQVFLNNIPSQEK